MTAPVDVLAVLEAVLADMARDGLALDMHYEDVDQARAAIAELIEAASRMLPRDFTDDDDDEARLRAALARVGGAA